MSGHDTDDAKIEGVSNFLFELTEKPSNLVVQAVRDQTMGRSSVLGTGSHRCHHLYGLDEGSVPTTVSSGEKRRSLDYGSDKVFY